MWDWLFLLLRWELYAKHTKKRVKKNIIRRLCESRAKNKLRAQRSKLTNFFFYFLFSFFLLLLFEYFLIFCRWLLLLRLTSTWTKKRRNFFFIRSFHTLNIWIVFSINDDVSLVHIVDISGSLIENRGVFTLNFLEFLFSHCDRLELK